MMNYALNNVTKRKTIEKNTTLINVKLEKTEETAATENKKIN